MGRHPPIRETPVGKVIKMRKRFTARNERNVMLFVCGLYIMISIAIVVSVFLPDIIAVVMCLTGMITDAISTIVSLYYCRGEISRNKDIIPVWEKYTLTIREAAEYFHVGEKRLRYIVKENPNADFVFVNGKRILIKKKLFEEYIDSVNEI